LKLAFAPQATRLVAKYDESDTNDCTIMTNFVVTKITASNFPKDKLQLGNNGNRPPHRAASKARGLLGPNIVGMMPDMRNLPTGGPQGNAGKGRRRR
jgi:hypothetical protein